MTHFKADIELYLEDKYLEGTVEYLYCKKVEGNLSGFYEDCYPEEGEEVQIEKLYLVIDRSEEDMSVLIPEVHKSLINQIKIGLENE